MIIIRKGSEVDLHEFVRLWNATWPNLPRSLDELEHEHSALPLLQRSSYFFAQVDGAIVGFAEVGWDVGSYHPQRLTLSIGVQSEYRNQGIGSELYLTAYDFIETYNPISLETRLNDEDSHSKSFACKRGFLEVKKDFESELDLTTFDPSKLSEVQTPKSVRLAFGAELESRDLKRQFHQLFEEIRADVPRVSPPTPMPFEQFRNLVLDEPNFLWDAVVLALENDELIGFSGTYLDVRPKALDQWLTGVRRPWRGKGLAKAIKAHGIRWALANGFESIRTSNDTRNAPMLAINDWLGFRRLPAMVTMVKTFSQAESSPR